MNSIGIVSTEISDEFQVLYSRALVILEKEKYEAIDDVVKDKIAIEAALIRIKQKRGVYAEEHQRAVAFITDVI